MVQQQSQLPTQRRVEQEAFNQSLINLPPQESADRIAGRMKSGPGILMIDDELAADKLFLQMVYEVLKVIEDRFGITVPYQNIIAGVRSLKNTQGLIDSTLMTPVTPILFNTPDAMTALVGNMAQMSKGGVFISDINLKNMFKDTAMGIDRKSRWTPDGYIEELHDINKGLQFLVLTQSSSNGDELFTHARKNTGQSIPVASKDSLAGDSIESRASISAKRFLYGVLVQQLGLVS